MAENQGLFATSLKRTNKQIKDDRADAIIKKTKMNFGRMVEDLKMELDSMIVERENLTDLSPTDAKSLVLASDFNEKDFIEKDLELSYKIRETEIRLKIATDRFETLFGTKPTGNV